MLTSSGGLLRLVSTAGVVVFLVRTDSVFLIVRILYGTRFPPAIPE
jgi:hypothetical protein